MKIFFRHLNSNAQVKPLTYIKVIGTLAVMLCFSCKKLVSDWNSIEVVNQAKYDIYIVPGYTKGWWMYEYPQTSLPSIKPNLIRIKKGTGNSIDSGLDWREIFKSMPRDTLSFYIFNADTVDAHEWSYIQKKYKVEKRLDYNYETMVASGYRITYP
jgi:hypothetical protein